MRLRSTRRDERGQGSLESVGVVILAAILVMATTGVIVQSSPSIKGEVSYRLCQVVNVVGGGDCAPPAPVRTAEDRIPEDPCTVSSDNGTAEVEASFVVTVSKGKQLLVEEMSDGTFKITEVDTGGVGWNPGVGIDVSGTVDGKKSGAVAAADAGAMLEGKKGKTWYADDEGEAKEIMEGLLAETILDQVAPDIDVPILPDPPNPVRELLEQLVGGTPDPDEEFVEGGIEGSAQASVSSILYGAGGEAEVGVYLGGKTTPDGYTAYYKQTASADVWGTLGPADASAGVGGELLIEVNFDKDGKPTSVKATSAYTLAADADALSIEDDQTYVETVAEVPLTGDPVHDAQALAILASPLAAPNFLQMAKDEGSVAKNTYSQDPDEFGFDATGEPLFGRFGLSASMDFMNRTLDEATYWDGTSMVDRPDC